MKLKNLKCDKTQKFKFGQNSETQNVTKLKNQKCVKTQTLKMRQFKKTNCDKTQILKKLTKM